MKIEDSIVKKEIEQILVNHFSKVLSENKLKTVIGELSKVFEKSLAREKSIYYFKTLIEGREQQKRDTMYRLEKLLFDDLNLEILEENR